MQYMGREVTQVWIGITKKGEKKGVLHLKGGYITTVPQTTLADAIKTTVEMLGFQVSMKPGHKTKKLTG